MTAFISNYGNALAIATQSIDDDLPYLLTKLNYLWKRLGERKIYKDGGTFIQQPLYVLPNLAQGFINGYSDVISINPNQNAIYGTYNWKYFYTDVTITLQDWTITGSSPHAVVDMLTFKTAGAMNDMTLFLSQKIWLGATGLDYNNFNGMQDVFATSGTAYAGISNTDYPDWFYLRDDSTDITYNNISGMLATLRSRTGMAPTDPVLHSQYKVDMLISPPSVQTAYRNQVQAQQRFTNSSVVKSGFSGIEVDNVFWYEDAFCTYDGTFADTPLYALTSDSFNIFYKYWPGEKKSPLDNKQIIPNQPYQIKVDYLAGNLMCSNRRVNGLFPSLTVA